MANSTDIKKYWAERYDRGETGWDIGQVSAPLKAYIDQLTNKNQKILIPGCGRAYEAQYLHEQGFNNVYVIDYVVEALDSFIDRTPDYPLQHIIIGDFFTHEGQYDLILEQTFFSSIAPKVRPEYVKKIHDLLAPSGKLAGVLFEFEVESGPPYGGTKNDYEEYFKHLFGFHVFDRCYNSNISRQDIELFIIFEKRCVPDT